MTQTVLLAGATGMFGSRIALHVLDQPEARLRLLVRSSEDKEKKAGLDPLVARGAEIINGDLGDRNSLDLATEGVDVIISAVQGGPDVIIDGQVALAQAGKRNGVRRILPSDYALDLFKATPGEHAMFDLRRRADEAIAATELEHVHVLQGAFMEMFGPGMGTIDYDNGTVTFWGDGTQPIEVTSVEDTARMVARVALDTTVGTGKFAFAGDNVSILDATKVVESQTRRKFERRSNGSETQLRAAMAEAAKDKSNPYKAVMLAYQLYMLTGQTALSDLQNERYPDIEFETFVAFAARTLPKTVSARAMSSNRC
ncbi:MAG TPA: NmrA family NAD(P)-binding protein [Candidatus Elarobacter sp.]|nr:NmrA family NAD(P)-binding protein [Candidatus Elarobacter sp.]